MRSSRLALFLAGAVCAALIALPAVASAALTPVSSLGSAGEGAGQLEAPGNAEYGPDGNLYVADYENDRIDVFSASGSFLYAFGEEVNITDSSDVCTAASGCSAGQGSEAAGGFNHPEDLTFLEGNLYVADVKNDRVDEFTAGGTFIRAFGKEVNVTDNSDVCTTASECRAGNDDGGDAAMAGPTGIVAAAGDLYVADRGDNRIDVFASEGEFLGAFGKEVSISGGDVCFLPGDCQEGADGNEAGEMDEPYSLAVDALGRLEVADDNNHRVDTYNTEGEFLRAFGLGVDPASGNVCTEATGCTAGAESEAAGGLLGPTAVAVDASGDIYVSDTEAERVNEFNPDGQFLRAFGAGVVDGAEAFQVCTTSCVKGLEGTVPGATPGPYGLAIDSQGQITVVEERSEMGQPEFVRIEQFADVAPAPPVVPKPVVPAPAPPSNGFKFGKLKLNQKKGTATLTVNVPDPGKVVLAGKGVKKVSKAAKKAGAVALGVKLVGKSKKALFGNGRATVKAKITFTPTGGSAHSATKKLTLRLKLP